VKAERENRTEGIVVPQNVAVAARADAVIRVESYALSTLPWLEEALARGLRDDWRRVVDSDPVASLFQTFGWCMPWYRCYADEYEPYVIVVSARERVVGVVPMAVDRATRAMVFACNTMADYRDVVALPGEREHVIGELIRHYIDGGFTGPLPIGWIDPASDTPALVRKICAARRLHCTVRHQPCWRWFPPAPVKPSAQKFLNWYKRNGTVRFEVIDSDAKWEGFREEYYRQHTLRQIQAGRQKAFDDARKTALYEEIFHSDEIPVHVTAFSYNGQMLAGHFGRVWRGVLMLGPTSIRLEDEQRSPAVILLSWIIQNAESLGLKGFDLTIGDSDFKARLANQRVAVTMIEVHAQSRGYYMQAARDHIVKLAKTGVERVAGEGAWKSKVKPAAAWLAYKRERFAEMGPWPAVKTAFVAAKARVYDTRVGLVYSITAAQVRPAQPKLAESETYEVHENQIEDLLLWRGHSPSTQSLLVQCARSYARVRNKGRTFHTIVVNGKLAGWGYSFLPTEPVHLTITPGATLEVEAGSASLYDFHVLREFRGRRVYQTLLSDILQKRFAAGATRAYITVLQANAPSRTAIERVGFQLLRRNFYSRTWNQERLTSLPAA